MLEKNILNEFDVTIVLDNMEYLNQKIFVEYIVDNKKKSYYKIIFNYSDENLINLKKYFSNEFVEGVKGFGKHIISNDVFHLILNVKTKSFELITWDNSLFINGKLVC